MIPSNDLLISDFLEQPNFDDGHKVFWYGLQLLCQVSIDEAMGAKIRDYVLNYVQNNSIALDNYSPENYVRTYIGRDQKTNVEAIIMSWSEGNRTAIHSHPDFACYTFAQGEFFIEVFEPTDNGGVRLKNSMVITEPTSLYAVGEKGAFTNYIHRITCLSKIGYSLHIYSDNALKGFKYDEES